MAIQKAKFSIGDIVKHKHFEFRGVIYDVDFEFNNSEEWYQSIPKNVRPRKDQPFYHSACRKRRDYIRSICF
jgi:heat shock protein HspQ